MSTTPSLRFLGPSGPIQRRYRFGPFDLDARAGELRKHGVRIRLRQQAVQVLLMLVEHSGEVVLREDIVRRLWPDDTVVEFDHSINVAVQRLREVLGDSSDAPRYIETLTGRGYRFLAPVETAPAPTNAVQKITKTNGPVPITPATEMAPTANWRLLVRVTAVVVLGLLAVAGWFRPREVRPPVRNWTLSLGAVPAPTVSPDGSAVFYRSPRGVVLRRLDSLAETTVEFPGPLIDQPAWSPDGLQILFSTMEGLGRLQVPHGASVMIGPSIGPPREAGWSQNGTILLAAFTRDPGRRDRSGLFVLPATGGQPTRVEVPGLDGGAFYEPEFLPNGEDFLFSCVSSGAAEGWLYVATLKNGKVTRGPFALRKNATGGHFSPARGGMLLYVEDNVLYAHKLNVAAGRLEGDPQRVVDGVLTRPAVRRAHFSVSRNGVLTWQAGKAALAQPAWFDRMGRVLGTAGPPFDIDMLRLSTDAKHILVAAASSFRMGVVESRQSALLDLPGMAEGLWLPTGNRILAIGKDPDLIFERDAATGSEREVVRIPGVSKLLDVSPDGTILLYRVGWSAYTMRLEVPPASRTRTPVAERQEIASARFSPDGKWIVYAARQGNRGEVFVRPLVSGSMRTQISSRGGGNAVWRGDGKEILFRAGKTIYAVKVETKGNEVHTGEPQRLFDVRLPDTLNGSSEPLAVTSDGSAILFPQGVEQPEPPASYVMTAWDSLLKR